MGLRMKNYGIHRKIQFLGRGSQKKNYRLKVLLGKKEGGRVFVGALIPQCTLKINALLHKACIKILWFDMYTPIIYD